MKHKTMKAHDGHHAHAVHHAMHAHKKVHRAKMGAPEHGGTSEHEGKPLGHGEFANMPQHAIMKPYPSMYSTDPHLDDTIVRIDGDTQDTEHKIRKDMRKGMY